MRWATISAVSRQYPSVMMPAAVLAELAVHGERSFSELQSSAGNRSDSSSYSWSEL